MLLLGYDIGSSFVKASLMDGATGKTLASASSPETEMAIDALKPGWAEQNPGTWWQNVKDVTAKILTATKANPADIGAIGIAYQMHGLVVVDADKQLLRPAIIWCDSRAAEIGDKAFNKLGKEKCLSHFLNSPGNFTASKLKWVKENEPGIFERIWKVMLPGDYIAMKMCSEVQTTSSGLSEGIFWDFKESGIANELLKHYGLAESLLPDMVETFSVQGELSTAAAKELGLKAGTKIAYRAGDQPNNAFSLNCLNPGEMAATAGTSGVIYGISDKATFDPKSRVNIFNHVNSTNQNPRYGILLCVNGTGILNSWLKRLLNTGGNFTYEQMNELAAQVSPGSDGLLFYPFGNGAERILENRNPGALLQGFYFNTHTTAHLLRAAQEGIVFALNYGLEVMQTMEAKARVLRAGNANMFLSPVFRNTMACLTGCAVELYETDGAEGAARGAGIGSGYFKNYKEAFESLKRITVVEPDKNLAAQYRKVYADWKNNLMNVL